MANISLLAKAKKDPFIGFIQEPWINNEGLISGLQGGGKLFAGACKNARTCIYAHSQVNLWLAAEYSNKDITTCIWKDALDGKNVYVASVYLDILHASIIPRKLRRLADYCKAHNEHLILCVDTNSHSTLWGCMENNVRGDALDDFLFEQNLIVLNRGAMPTFETSRASSIIDITVASEDLSNSILNWQVHSEDHFSDHKLISMQARLSTPEPALSRNLKKADWGKFKDLVETSLTSVEIPTLWTNSVIEGEVSRLMSVIEDVLDKVCPKTKRGSKAHISNWWTPELDNLRTKILGFHTRARESRSDTDWDVYKQEKKLYSKAIRKAKKESWKRFTGELANPKEVSRFTKIIRGGSQASIGLMKDKDGRQARSPEQSLKILMDEHFPGSSEVIPQATEDGELFHDNLQPPSAARPRSWITKILTKAAVDSMDPYKAGGPDEVKTHHPPKSTGLRYRTAPGNL